MFPFSQNKGPSDPQMLIEDPSNDEEQKMDLKFNEASQSLLKNEDSPTYDNPYKSYADFRADVENGKAKNELFSSIRK